MDPTEGSLKGSKGQAPFGLVLYHGILRSCNCLAGLFSVNNLGRSYGTRLGLDRGVGLFPKGVVNEANT